MNCPNCGKHISFRQTRCEYCQHDLKSYKKLWSISNQYYNLGLQKAKLRDLSGAIIALKNSLQVNKRNIQARNLLGLVYYEQGEIVLALGHWVISNNYQEKDNLAEYYMNLLQNNPAKLHAANQVVKKYNYALAQVKSGNYDVALLQLKKVVASQPNYLVAQQLLSLLYMRDGDNEKAAKQLKKAQRIDINNTRTVMYLGELGLNSSSSKRVNEVQRQVKKKQIQKSDNPKFFLPDADFRDGKINRGYFMYLLIGVAIGMLVGFFLILPARGRALANKYNREVVEMAEQQTDMTYQMQTLEEEKEELKNEMKQLEKKVKKMKEEAVDEKAYDTFAKAVVAYMAKKNDEAAELLMSLDMSKFNSTTTKELYDTISKATFPNMSRVTYNEGRRLFDTRKYDEATEKLLLALKYDETNTDAMYYLGRCYQMTGDNKKAKKYYTLITENYSTSYRMAEATRRLDELETQE